MSAGLARNWWVVGLRAVTGVAFVICILLLPRPTLAALAFTFAAYLAADGLLAIMAGMRSMKRGERWPTLVLEGAINLAAVGAVLVWAAIAAVPFLHLASIWAMITGGFLIAAARRLSVSHGRPVLALAGIASGTWGALASTAELLFGGTAETAGWWLIGYAAPFATILLVLAGLLQRRDRQATAAA
jgi:uncharacterized membrane protein HdeD (DUF308 family)